MLSLFPEPDGKLELNVKKRSSGKPYRPVVAGILNQFMPKTILDAPSGSGWLKSMLNYGAEIDGLDLFEAAPPGYRSFRSADLDSGLPAGLPQYEFIVSCEAIEHIRNPGLFLKSAGEHLVEGGGLIVTTPNTWHPGSRLQFLLRGFFPGFPCLVGNIRRGAHMHIMPWSFPQLYLYLKLVGFSEIRLHETDEKKPKRAYEKILGLPQYFYCNSKFKKANTGEEQAFWRIAGSPQSLYGRHLVISARFMSKTTLNE
jgi:SAM-dependent methyltransferase